jgi:GntR family transcriptional repressor for pyruvate dehydrogenase complex
MGGAKDHVNPDTSEYFQGCVRLERLKNESGRFEIDRSVISSYHTTTHDVFYISSHFVQHGISRPRVRDQVFDQLHGQVLSGAWKAGQRIPSENELSIELGASRVTIRECLQKLVTLGLLEARQGEGTFVRQYAADMHLNSLYPLLALDRPALRDVLEYRRIMEGGTAGLAAERASAEDIAGLERIYACMQGSRNDMAAFARADLDFHIALAQVTRNPIIAKVNQIIRAILDSSMVIIVTTLGVQDGLHYHRRLIDAIAARDPAEAERLMQEHILRTIERLAAAAEDQHAEPA